MIQARSIRYGLAGVLLALGAPLGWMLIRQLTAERAPGVVTELIEHRALYVYLTVGTSVAFGIFGLVLGSLADGLLRLNAQLGQMAVTDALTSLRNARYFQQRLPAECARSDRDQRPLALIMLDLDDFKRVNDRCGHVFGDRALADAARIIASSIRVGDVACRIGGEEFAVICPGADSENAVAIAERIRSSLKGARLGTTGDVSLSASLGVAVHLAGNECTGLVQQADSALYAAKHAGKDRVAYSSPEGTRVVDKMSIAS